MTRAARADERANDVHFFETPRALREWLAAGRMRPAGRRVFDARDEARSAIYSYERATAALDDDAEAAFRANEAAWAWFQQAPQSYRRAATHWVTSAVKPETRARRLATLIADAAEGRLVKPLTPLRSSRERP